MATAAIVLGYLGIIQAFGWWGAAAAVAHLGALALSTWRAPVAEVDAERMQKSAGADMR